jgi:hypothetical protein
VTADRTIPLYDAAAPIACTIRPDETAGRVLLLERMRTNLVSLDRTAHGLLLRFTDRPDVEDDVRRFAADEKRCCTFWGFAVDRTGGHVTLRWDAPPDAGEILARIATYLDGDEPLTALDGLL